MNLFKLLLSLLIFMFSLNLFSQDDIDVVYLKNGSIIRGKIIEQVPNQSIKIKTADGSIFVYKFDEIEKMTRVSSEDGSGFSFSKPQNSGFIGSLSGGIGIPFGDLSDGWLASYNFGGNAGYVFSNLFGARLDIAYNTFAPDLPSNLTNASGGRFSVISLRADFLIGDFKKKTTVVPYGLFGLGMYFKNVSDLKVGTVIVRSGDESEFGIGLGGGVGFKVAKNIAIFGELQYNLGFGDDPVSSFMPIKAGIMFTP